jgi:hypothetical protein
VICIELLLLVALLIMLSCGILVTLDGCHNLDGLDSAENY